MNGSQTRENTDEESLRLLSCSPDRVGHATFIKDEAKDILLKGGTCIEICLSSNLL